MDNFFNNTHLMQMVKKWKWHLLIMVSTAALVSIVVSSSLFMKPRFKSVAYIYPSNILPYSEESQTEQMLQWMSSTDIRDSVVKKFDLPKHYKVLTTDPHYASTMEELFNKNVSISKTKYESVEVVVTDIDPVIARDMVKAILYFTDVKIRATHYVNYKNVFDAIEKRLNSKLDEMDSVKNKYREIATTYGLYDLGGQSREIARGDLGTVDGSGNKINSKDVQRLKQGMIEKSGELMYLTNRISYSAAEFSEIERLYEGAKYEIDKKVTFINVVTPPLVADKKSYPKRLFILFYFVAGTLFFSLLAIAFIEWSKVPSSEINN